jgi:hypothetical protein
MLNGLKLSHFLKGFLRYSFTIEIINSVLIKTRTAIRIQNIQTTNIKH